VCTAFTVQETVHSWYRYSKELNFLSLILITEDGENKEDIIQWIKEAKVTFNNKKLLLCGITLVWK
jgi:hypothetical protein